LLDPKNQKNIFVSFVHSFIIIFGENKHFEKEPHPFARLIKGIVLGRMLWITNTFPTRNRLLNLKFVFVDLVLIYIVFHSFP